MSHEVVSMFSTRETPWHGLGHVLTDAPNVEEAIKLAGADWQVACRPVYCEGHDASSMARGVVRTDTGDLLGIVGPRYKPLQNSDLFGWFRPWVESGQVELETGGVLHNGQTVWALARITGEAVDVTPGDTVHPYVLLSNSHTGKERARVGLTPIRVVCANTLGAAHEKGASQLVQVYHRDGLVDALERAREGIDLARHAWSVTADQYRDLASRGIRARDIAPYVRAVFSPKSTEVDFESIVVQTETLSRLVEAKRESMSVSIGDILTATEERASGAIDDVLAETEGRLIATITERLEAAPGAGSTWWHLYNAVTHYVTHDRGARADRRLASAISGANARTTDRALSAAIKGAQS